MRPLSLFTVAVAAALTVAAGPGGVDGPAVTDGDDLADGLGEATSPAGTPGSAPAPAGDELVGTFALTAGECSDGAVTGGSYFRMQNQAGGYVGNGSSPCGDDTYTPLRPGTDGGLVTDSYQPHPDPAFDDSGNGLADAITQPEAFFGTEFSTATNPTDPQTRTDVPAPRIVHDGAGGLSGDVRAFAAAWNGQHFNQGAPKPDGSQPGGTSGPTGTYDPATGEFTLEWTSRIQGGPFNGFTGEWHLEGTFEPSDGGAAESDAAPEGGSQDQTDPQQATGQDTDGSVETQSGSQDDAAADTDDSLPETGPGLPPVLGLALLAGAALLAMARRPAPARGQQQ